MNDLPFIFYRPRDMFLDTVGMSKEGKVAHRQLADYVWYNDGPAANENELLREITSCAISDWARVKRELIGKGWVETPKFFLHKGIIKTLNYSKKKAVESHNKTAAANKLPKHELLDPHPETGVCAISVTHPVTSVIGDRDREGDIEKKEGEGARGGEGGEHRTSNESEIPDFEGAFAMTVNAGILKDFCKYVFDDWSSRSGKDGGGNVVAWLPYVTKRWARESVEWRAGTHKGNKKQAKTGGNF
jgi:hypothetical protein